MDGSIQVRFFQLTVSILIACPGPDEPKIYKKQYKRHCVIIEELLEAGAQDDELVNSILPDIPDKCPEVSHSLLLKPGSYVRTKILKICPKIVYFFMKNAALGVVWQRSSVKVFWLAKNDR